MSTSFRIVVGLLSGLSFSVTPACGPDQPRLAPLTTPITSHPEGARVTINARVRDLRAAVMRALPSVEFAPLQESGTPDEGFLDFVLIGLHNEPGHVRIEFPSTKGSLPALREPRPTTITVSIGHFGNPTIERNLVKRIAREALTLGESTE